VFHRTVVADRRAARSPHLQDLSDETEALSRQCLDQALFLAGIADRVPRGIEASCQRFVGDDAPAPNGIDEVVLADDALPVADQIIEQVEYLWRDRDDFPRRGATRGGPCRMRNSRTNSASCRFPRWPPIVEAPAPVATPRISRR
jgi:hypothetical protein